MNIQDPTVRTKVRQAMGEISASMTRIEAERDLIKEIVKKIHDEHDLPKKALSKMAKAYHKQSFSKEVEEQEEFQTLYETVLGTNG
jgi:uncharacterized FlgJ-related protein